MSFTKLIFAALLFCSISNAETSYYKTRAVDCLVTNENGTTKVDSQYCDGSLYWLQVTQEVRDGKIETCFREFFDYDYGTKKYDKINNTCGGAVNPNPKNLILNSEKIHGSEKRTLFHMKEMTYQFALQTKYSSEYKTTLNTLLEKINTQGPLPGNPSFPNFPLPPSYPHSK